MNPERSFESVEDVEGERERQKVLLDASYYPICEPSMAIQAPHLEPDICGRFDYFDSQESTSNHISRLRLWFYTLLSAVILGLLKWGVMLLMKVIRTTRMDLMVHFAETTGAIYASMGIMAAYAVVFAIVMTAFVVLIAPAAGGGGIPDLKGFLNGNLLPDFLSFATLCGRLLGVCLLNASGMMLGPEGPMAHVGTIVNVLVPRWLSPFPLSDKQMFDFASVGSGMGISAAFSAPIAGTLFALEEASSYWHPELISRTFFGAIIAAIVGEYTTVGFVCEEDGVCVSAVGEFAFTEPAKGESTFKPWEMPLFIALGICMGLVAVCMSHLLLLLAKFRKAYVKTLSWKITDSVAIFIISTLLYCLVTLATDCVPSSALPIPTHTEAMSIASAMCPDPATQFNPLAMLLLEPRLYVVRTLFSGSGFTDLLFTPIIVWIAILCVFLTIVLTMGLSMPVGMFIPSVVCGALFGRLFGTWIVNLVADPNNIYPGIYALAGAAGLLSGISRMTVWVTVVMIEAASNVDLTIPVVLSVMSAKFVADLVMHHPLYEALIEGKGVRYLAPIDDARTQRRLFSKCVSEVMTAPVVTVRHRESKGAVKAILALTTHSHFVVIGDQGVVIGVVKRADLEGVLVKVSNKHLSDEVLVEMPKKAVPISVRRDLELHKGYYLFTQMGMRVLTVTDEHNRLEGLITRNNFIRYLSINRDFPEQH